MKSVVWMDLLEGLEKGLGAAGSRASGSGNGSPSSSAPVSPSRSSQAGRFTHSSTVTPDWKSETLALLDTPPHGPPHGHHQDDAASSAGASTPAKIPSPPSGKCSRNKPREEKAPCPGCDRDPDGGAFGVKGEVVMWALPEARGLWCKDCFTVWRTVYGCSHSLTVFTMWLKHDSNLTEFQLNLLAYLSLKREGCDKIARETILMRAESLRFCLRLLCLPCGPSIVVPLRDLATGNVKVPEGHRVTGESLLTIVSGEGPVLATYVPTSHKTPSPELERPDLELPVLRQLAKAITSCEDASAFSHFFGECPEGPVVRPSMDQEALSSCTDVMKYQSNMRPTSKLANKFEVMPLV